MKILALKVIMLGFALGLGSMSVWSSTRIHSERSVERLFEPVSMLMFGTGLLTAGCVLRPRSGSA